MAENADELLLAVDSSPSRSTRQVDGCFEVACWSLRSSGSGRQLLSAMRQQTDPRPTTHYVHGLLEAEQRPG